jgi:hypothetical protein
VNPPKCDDLYYSAFSLQPQKFLPAPKQRGAHLKKRKPLPICLHSTETIFRHKGVVAGGESLCGPSEGAFGSGRYDFEQALCPEGGVGDLSLE